MSKKEKQASEDKGPGLIERFFLRMVIKKTIKKIENMKGISNTTALAWLSLVGVFLGSLLIPVLDGDPATIIDWDAVTVALQNAGIVIPAWLIGIFAKDDDKKKTAEPVAKK